MLVNSTIKVYPDLYGGLLATQKRRSVVDRCYYKPEKKYAEGVNQLERQKYL